MSDKSREGEVDFPIAREQIEKEIETWLEASEQEVHEVPRFVLEKGMIHFSFPVPTLSAEKIFIALEGIKRHIEYIRIHTFEPGYVIFQAMGPNLYESAGLLDGIKFKFTGIGSSIRVQAVRKANLIQDEIQACIQLFKTFHSGGAAQDPATRFRALGVQLYGIEDTSIEEGGKAGEKKGAAHASNAANHDFIAGYKKTRIEIRESIILPLQNSEIFREVARLTRGREIDTMPRAILFEGPPGVGKTTMVRMIARETGIPMAYIPVENIISKYYGESAQNMAAIFDAASVFPRIILFLDEIDSLAGSRESGMFEATRRVLSTLLRKIDGMESRRGTLVIGATNRSQDLDHALLSRFDQTIAFPLPDDRERIEIFAGYARHLHADGLEELSLLSAGFSGRNIQDTCSYAERRWARRLISQKAIASPPPLDIYLEIAAERQKSSQNSAP